MKTFDYGEYGMISALDTDEKSTDDDTQGDYVLLADAKSRIDALTVERDALRAQLAQGEAVAWLVTGPYEKVVSSCKDSAEAFCNGLNKGYGETAYSVLPLYTAPHPAKAVTDEREAFE